MTLLDREFTAISNQVEHIIYIDNNSANRKDVIEWIQDKASKAQLILMPDNEGIGAAQNAGIKRALQDGASHVVIFDQDSVVDEGFVNALLRAEKNAIREGLKVGLTGPVYQSFDDVFVYPIRTLKNNRMGVIPFDSFDDYVQVSHIIASGSLIRREVIEEIGLLNEFLFIGYIDYEYCFRALSKGFVSIVTKNACMHHMMGDRQIKILGRKIGIYSPFRRYFDCRNTILIQKQKILPAVVCGYYRRLLYGKVFVSLLFGPDRLKQAKFMYKGFSDGIKNITGKCTIYNK